ncbi:hypothetical protein GCM10010390_49900 [Streptomyces mordarskii]|uniref:Uncharacterized protein n=1 Tax=Streptomyces mordarskii TaxID=1226758 RepID=A0ABP3NDQ7_9ACTN
MAHPVQPAIERTGILQVECHRDVPRTPSGFDVIDVHSQPQPVIRGYPLPPARDQADDVISTVGNVAHVHRNEAASRPAIAGQFSNICAPLQRQATVLIPKQSRAARS